MSLKYIIAHLLEPISYFLFFSAILIHLRINNDNSKNRVLVFYFLIGLLLLVGTTLVEPNIYLYRYLYLLTGVCYGIYFSLLFKSFYKRWLMLLSSAITILYYLFEQVYSSGVALFPSMGYTIVSICIILMIFTYFYQLMTHVTEESLSLNFDFWFICSLLIYHLGAFSIFLTYNKLTQNILPTEYFSSTNRALMSSLWGAHNILLFLASLITWTGVIWIMTKNKNSIYTKMKR